MHKKQSRIDFPHFPFWCLLDQSNNRHTTIATRVVSDGRRKVNSLREIIYLLNVVLLEGLGGAIDGVLLHLLAHVSVLNHGLSITHFVVLDCL